MTNPFATIEQAIAALKVGRMIMLLDDENRENEGDLVIAAEHATSEAINFMSRFGRGLICLPMSEELIDELKLPMMAANNRSPYGTAFTVRLKQQTACQLEFQRKIARKQLLLLSPRSPPRLLFLPAICFLLGETGGVLERAGQTEGLLIWLALPVLNLLRLFVKSLMKMEP